MSVHTPLLHRLDALAWTLYAFELPLLGCVRKGLLLCVKDIQGNAKWAEIAPYPGRSAETLEEAKEQLIAILQGENTSSLYPSVQCALEYLSAPSLEVSDVPLYAFLNGTCDDILKNAQVVKNQGFKTVKVKLTSLTTSESLLILDHLQKMNFRLRIDCNATFSMQDAHNIFSTVDPNLLDYVEDPTYERDKLDQFPYPLALDETLKENQTFSFPNLYGFILKPTILGGIQGCTPYIELAKKHNLKVVFSPAFESGIGLLQIVHVAKHFNLLADPIGLDTHRYLQCDLTDINFSVPFFTFNKVPCIQHTSLTEIAHGTNPLPHC